MPKKIIVMLCLLVAAFLVFVVTDADARLGGDCPNPVDCGDKTAHGFYCASFTCLGDTGDYCIICSNDIPDQ